MLTVLIYILWLLGNGVDVEGSVYFMFFSLSTQNKSKEMTNLDKGGLMSESFTLWLQSPRKGAKSQL